ncbi:putative glutamic acid-rich protein precursor, partial [Trypanosoma cruzi]
MIYSQKTQDDSEVVVPAAGETFVAEDGTVSVVLADTVDDDYEPTQDEIEDFAEWMGMQLPEDKEFLYIAREGLKAPLPKNWRPCRTNEDDIYYFNFRTGESTWNHPMDDFFRQKFLKMKEEKKSSTVTTPVVTKHAAVPTSTTGGVPTLGSSGGGGGPVSILKKSPSDLIGGMPGTATHA